MKFMPMIIGMDGGSEQIERKRAEVDEAAKFNRDAEEAAEQNKAAIKSLKNAIQSGNAANTGLLVTLEQDQSDLDRDAVERGQKRDRLRQELESLREAK